MKCSLSSDRYLRLRNDLSHCSRLKLRPLALCMLVPVDLHFFSAIENRIAACTSKIFPSFGKVWNFAEGKTINFYMEPQYSVWRSGVGAPGWQLFTGVNFQFPVHFQFWSK
jgi:hypothetical protein